jgi:hypothetical protein
VVDTLLVPLNLVLGGAWVAIAILNLGAMALFSDVTSEAWLIAGLSALGVAALILLSAGSEVRGALAAPTPAAGVPIASPATTLTVALFPIAIMVAVMLLLAVAGQTLWSVVVAAMFLGCGAAYAAVGWWARRLELAEGLIVIVPANRLGLRRKPRALRLPR